MKRCSRCKFTMPVSEFHKNASRKDGLQHQCKLCARDQKLTVLYGINSFEWERIFVAQGRRCAVCQTDTPGHPNWHTDHDHETGRVRGILCQMCNVRIGQMEGWYRQHESAIVTYLNQ